MNLAAGSFQQTAQGFIDGLIAVIDPLVTTTLPIPAGLIIVAVVLMVIRARHGK